MKKPRIAVPMGDAAGIGPEITAKAAAALEVSEAAECVVIGEKTIMEQAIQITGAELDIHLIREPEEGEFRQGVLNLIDLKNLDKSQIVFGKVNGMCGKAAYEYIEKSILLAS